MKNTDFSYEYKSVLEDHTGNRSNDHSCESLVQGVWRSGFTLINPMTAAQAAFMSLKKENE